MQTFKIKRYDYVTAAKAISLLTKIVQKTNFMYSLNTMMSRQNILKRSKLEVNYAM